MYLEPFQTFKIDLFARIANGCKPLTIFTNYSILNIWLGSENISAKSSTKTILQNTTASDH